MADEQARPPYNRKPIVPTELGWASLLERDGEELERHYRKILDERALRSGPQVRDARGDLQKGAAGYPKPPPRSAAGIVDSVDTENWSSIGADIKGDIYEGLLGGKAPPKAALLTKGARANTSRPAN